MLATCIFLIIWLFAVTQDVDIDLHSINVFIRDRDSAFLDDAHRRDQFCYIFHNLTFLLLSTTRVAGFRLDMDILQKRICNQHLVIFLWSAMQIHFLMFSRSAVSFGKWLLVLFSVLIVSKRFLAFWTTVSRWAGASNAVHYCIILTVNIWVIHATITLCLA